MRNVYLDIKKIINGSSKSIISSWRVEEIAKDIADYFGMNTPVTEKSDFEKLVIFKLHTKSQEKDIEEFQNQLKGKNIEIHNLRSKINELRTEGKGTFKLEEINLAHYKQKREKKTLNRLVRNAEENAKKFENELKEIKAHNRKLLEKLLQYENNTN